jgi:hypothetical protein
MKRRDLLHGALATPEAADGRGPRLRRSGASSSSRVTRPTTSTFIPTPTAGRASSPTVGCGFGRIRRGRLMLGVSFEWNEGKSHAVAMVARIQIPSSVLLQAVELVQ